MTINPLLIAVSIKFLSVLLVVGWPQYTGHLRRIGDVKIVGGELVDDIRTVPYMVNLQQRDPEFQDEWWVMCGGTLFTSLYVVTACHCVASDDNQTQLIVIPVADTRFIAGTKRLVAQEKETVQIRTATWMKHHPKCILEDTHPMKLQYDFAIAKMAEPFKINDYVKPVKFFSFNKKGFEAAWNKIITSEDINNSNTFQKPPVCVTAGWGQTMFVPILENLGLATTPAEEPATSYNPDASTEDFGGDNLKRVDVYPMNARDCLIKTIDRLRQVLETVGKAYLVEKEGAEAGYAKLLTNQICAETKDGKAGQCQGDSGSGLICNGFLFGVTSWGLGCGDSAPNVFQSIPNTLEWFSKEVCTVQNCQDAVNIHPLCEPPSPEFLKTCNIGVVTAPPATMQSPASTNRMIFPGLLISVLCFVSYASN